MLLDGFRLYRVRGIEQSIAPGVTIAHEYAWRDDGAIRSVYLADEGGTVAGSSGLELAVFRVTGAQHWANDGTRPTAVASGAMRGSDDWEWLPLDQRVSSNDLWRLEVTNRGPLAVVPALLFRFEDA